MAVVHRAITGDERRNAYSRLLSYVAKAYPDLERKDGEVVAAAAIRLAPYKPMATDGPLTCVQGLEYEALLLLNRHEWVFEFVLPEADLDSDPDMIAARTLIAEFSFEGSLDQIDWARDIASKDTVAEAVAIKSASATEDGQLFMLPTKAAWWIKYRYQITEEIFKL